MEILLKKANSLEMKALKILELLIFKSSVASEKTCWTIITYQEELSKTGKELLAKEKKRRYENIK